MSEARNRRADGSYNYRGKSPIVAGRWCFPSAWVERVLRSPEMPGVADGGVYFNATVLADGSVVGYIAWPCAAVGWAIPLGERHLRPGREQLTRYFKGSNVSIESDRLRFDGERLSLAQVSLIAGVFEAEMAFLSLKARRRGSEEMLSPLFEGPGQRALAAPDWLAFMPAGGEYRDLRFMRTETARIQVSPHLRPPRPGRRPFASVRDERQPLGLLSLTERDALSAFFDPPLPGVGFPLNDRLAPPGMLPLDEGETPRSTAPAYLQIAETLKRAEWHLPKLEALRVATPA